MYIWNFRIAKNPYDMVKHAGHLLMKESFCFIDVQSIGHRGKITNPSLNDPTHDDWKGAFRSSGNIILVATDRTTCRSKSDSNLFKSRGERSRFQNTFWSCLATNTVSNSIGVACASHRTTSSCLMDGGVMDNRMTNDQDVLQHFRTIHPFEQHQVMLVQIKIPVPSRHTCNDKEYLRFWNRNCIPVWEKRGMWQFSNSLEQFWTDPNFYSDVAGVGAGRAHARIHIFLSEFPPFQFLLVVTRVSTCDQRCRRSKKDWLASHIFRIRCFLYQKTRQKEPVRPAQRGI